MHQTVSQFLFGNKNEEEYIMSIYCRPVLVGNITVESQTRTILDNWRTRTRCLLNMATLPEN